MDEQKNQYQGSLSTSGVGRFCCKSPQVARDYFMPNSATDRNPEVTGFQRVRVIACEFDPQ
jgi:hypothetical protein